MQWKFKFISTILVLSLQTSESKILSNANIVFIVADDMGWDDVSFHGSDQVFTPNIDVLAYSGVAFSRYYSSSICTPSRAATLSGKYAHTLGMQGYPLTGGEDRGIPENVKLLPEYFKDLGYKTHLVGKWHVGHSRKKFLPTSRGFDSHFGHRTGFIDYYEHINEENWNIGPVTGFDLYRNLTPAFDVEGYITDVYTQEAVSVINNHDTSTPLFLMVSHVAPHAGNYGTVLQAPPEEVRKLNYIENAERRYYSAMVKKLDDSIGYIYKGLNDKKILNNTIIVFVSDNGGQTSGSFANYASNWPLRGLKMTPYEGGIRLIGLLWTSTIQSNVWNGYVHSTDWLPTLLGAVSGNTVSGIDGINLWDVIVNNETSKRNEIYEINDFDGYSSIISGNYKYVIGDIDPNFSNHQGDELRGFKGTPPSYFDLITNSTVYSVMMANRQPFTLDKIATRQQIRVNCLHNYRQLYPSHLTPPEVPTLCQPRAARGCLFNIKDDPCELKDVTSEHLDIVRELVAKLTEEFKRVMIRPPTHRDERALPKFHNYTWDVFIDT